MVYMKRLVTGCLAVVSACGTFEPLVLAPGASDVRVTNVAADVASCNPIGNIQLPRDGDGFVSPVRALGQLKNQAIGFGGNAAFVTEGSLDIPLAGVAYRCP
jgi:hypothetical protein